MSPTDEQQAVLSVLRVLRQVGEEWMRRGRERRESAEDMIPQWQFNGLTETQLDNYLMYRGRIGRFEDNEVIYLEPPPRERSSVAAMWCRWNFDLEVPSCGFHFGIWVARRTYPGSSVPDVETTIGFVGFRYETPEEGDNHNYYHAQPSRSLGTRDNSYSHALPISHRYPTFPLAATSSLDLLLCLVTSIHGMRGLRRLRSRVSEDASSRTNKTLSRAFERLLWLQRSEAFNS